MRRPATPSDSKTVFAGYQSGPNIAVPILIFSKYIASTKFKYAALKLASVVVKLNHRRSPHIVDLRSHSKVHFQYFP